MEGFVKIRSLCKKKYHHQNKFIFSLPKSTASKAIIFMAYSEVYLIILHLGGTSSFLDGVLRQRIPGSNMA